MSDSSVQVESNPRKQAPTKARKSYHTPKMEKYGAVNELTRGGGAPFDDGGGSYSSVPN